MINLKILQGGIFIKKIVGKNINTSKETKFEMKIFIVLNLRYTRGNVP